MINMVENGVKPDHVAAIVSEIKLRVGSSTSNNWEKNNCQINKAKAIKWFY